METAVGGERGEWTRRVRSAYLYKWKLTQPDREFLVGLDVRLLRYGPLACVSPEEGERLAVIELRVAR